MFFMLKRGEDKKDITIDQIRALKRFVSLSPFSFKHKLVLVDNAHQMRREGFNSLLKTLEEPSPETTIILVTHRYLRLPPTVRSRAVTIRFQGVPERDFKKGLEVNGVSLPASELAWINNRPGLAIRYSGDPGEPTISEFRNHFLEFAGIFKKRFHCRPNCPCPKTGH